MKVLFPHTEELLPLERDLYTHLCLFWFFQTCLPMQACPVCAGTFPVRENSASCQGLLSVNISRLPKERGSVPQSPAPSLSSEARRPSAGTKLQTPHSYCGALGIPGNKQAGKSSVPQTQQRALGSWGHRGPHPLWRLEEGGLWARLSRISRIKSSRRGTKRFAKEVS